MERIELMKHQEEGRVGKKEGVHLIGKVGKRQEVQVKGKVGES